MTRHFVFKGEDLGEFDPDKITMNQAMMLEDKTGFTVEEVAQAAKKLSGRATQALVWFMRVKSGQTDADLHEDFMFGDISSKEVDDEETDEGKGRSAVKAVKAA